MAGVEELDILWISEGMSCDGDSVSVTAAGQPGIEDVLLGAIPGIPKVNLHNKVLSPTLGGEEFLTPFRAAARGAAALPFVLVIEGSIPNEKINGDGYWSSFGNDEATGEPLTLNWWIDQLAPKAWGVVAIGTCATYGGIHAMAGNPTGCMGLADYLGWDFRSAGGLPIVNVPGCPVQPENFMETLTWLLYQAAGLAPTIPLALFALFQLKFAIITPALTTGAFAERIRFGSYLLFMSLFTFFVYAPLAHWTCHPEGFLRQWGVLDFAGGTVVHISAGVAALAAAWYLGPRKTHARNEPHAPAFGSLAANARWFTHSGRPSPVEMAGDHVSGMVSSWRSQNAMSSPPPVS